MNCTQCCYCSEYEDTSTCTLTNKTVTSFNLCDSFWIPRNFITNYNPIVYDSRDEPYYKKVYQYFRRRSNNIILKNSNTSISNEDSEPPILNEDSKTTASNPQILIKMKYYHKDKLVISITPIYDQSNIVGLEINTYDDNIQITHNRIKDNLIVDHNDKDDSIAVLNTAKSLE